uniref:Apple domain-containing protein n=1 Tax=Denticeps clupeoides TaxID=299321 RepID=A0AAY4DA20_9TELE
MCRLGKILLHAMCIFERTLCLCPDCDDQLKVNVDFPGNDILQVYSPDAIHCQLTCSQHHSCQFFTFLRQSWKYDNRTFYCYLKQSNGVPPKENQLNDVTSGYSLRSCPQKTGGVCIRRIFTNIDFDGADYRVLLTGCAGECQRACIADPACQFFRFMNSEYQNSIDRYKCFLMYSGTVPRPPSIIPSSFAVSGFSPNFYKEKVNFILENTLIPMRNVEEVPAVSAEHCQTLCRTHPRCTFFSYSSRFICYLKQSVESALKDPFQNVDFLGADMLHVMVDSPEACLKKCTDDPSCQFYTYVNSISCKKDCYLKRVVSVPLPRSIAIKSGVESGFSIRHCGYNCKQKPPLRISYLTNLCHQLVIHM